MMGIYKITNLINGKVYIGQSINIERRWQEHLYQSSGCSLLKYALHKYGVDNFSFEVIEECRQEELNEKEKLWIQYYDSFNNGYNLTLGGGGLVKYNVEQVYETYQITKNIAETAKQIGCHRQTVHKILKEYGINHSEFCQEKPVEKIDPITLKVIKTYNSISEAARSIGLSTSSVQMVLYGKSLSAGGFYWQYKGENRTFPQLKKPTKKWKIKVKQIDPITNKTIQEFESAADAAESLGKDRKNGGSQISAVCSGRKKTAMGFKWEKVAE